MGTIIYLFIFEQADDYEQSGILEETLVQEAAHTSSMENMPMMKGIG